MNEPLRKSLLDVGKGVLTAVLVAAILALPIKAAVEWGFRKWQRYRDDQAYPRIWLEVEVPTHAAGDYFTVVTLKLGSTVQFDGYALEGTNPYQPFQFIAHVPADSKISPTVSQNVFLSAASNASNNFHLSIERPGTLRVQLQTGSLGAPKMFFFEPRVLAGEPPSK